MNDEIRSQGRSRLLASLRARNYHFITPTPATHARVIARRSRAHDLRDVFGWSLSFERDLLDGELLEALRAADAVEERDGQLASRLRVSSLDDDLFLHSAFPTTAPDSVFFGPDSYRFAALIRAEVPRFAPIHRLVDVGTGSGVGAIAALRSARIEHVTGTDVNFAALQIAMANAAGAPGLPIHVFDTAHCNGLVGLEGPIDCIIANPPYIADPLHRAYRDGGAMHGAALSLDWAKQAAEKLAPGGAFLLYTGSAIINGEDSFKAALFETLHGFDISYRELDPDVFGEELEREDYADVERIAVVGCVAVKR